jgi:hypothetical protein
MRSRVLYWFCFYFFSVDAQDLGYVVLREQFERFLGSVNVSGYQMPESHSPIPSIEFLEQVEKIAKTTKRGFKIDVVTMQPILSSFSKYFPTQVSGNLPDSIYYGALINFWIESIAIIFLNEQVSQASSLLEKIYHAYGKSAFDLFFWQCTGENYDDWARQYGCDFIARQERMKIEREMSKTDSNNGGIVSAILGFFRRSTLPYKKLDSEPHSKNV